MKLDIGILGYMTRSVGIAVSGDGTQPICVQLDYGVDWRSWGKEVYTVPGEIIYRILPRYNNGNENQHLKTVTTAVTGYDYRFFGNRFRDILSSHGDPLSKFHLSNLSEAAHRGAFVDREGVLVRCGHGSSVYARLGQFRVITGGWGTVSGDDGSGIWLGHQAVSCITELHDKSASPSRSELAIEILHRLSNNNSNKPSSAPTLLEELFDIRGINEITWKQRLYEIGMELINISASDSLGCAAALKIVDCGHRRLVSLVRGCLASANASTKTDFDVCLVGSTFGNSWYIARFKEHLNDSFPRATLIPPRYSPIMGIALLAVANSGNATNQELGSFVTSWGQEPWALSVVRE